jgi:acetylglutamate kinase
MLEGGNFRRRIPKLETAVEAVENGAARRGILDGRIPHVLCLELFTEHICKP